MVVIGGIGTFEGPILGALVYFALRETLSQLGPYYLMILGAVAIAIMLFEPRGLWGALRARDWAGVAAAELLCVRPTMKVKDIRRRRPVR